MSKTPLTGVFSCARLDTNYLFASIINPCFLEDLSPSDMRHKIYASSQVNIYLGFFFVRA